MFKNFNWQKFLNILFTAILAGLTGLQVKEYVRGSNSNAEATAIVSGAPLNADYANLASDDGNCNAAKFCAIYEVYAFWKQPIKIGGGGTLEYSFDVKTTYTKAVVISDAYTDLKAKTALEKVPPYPGWSVDKVISNKRIQYIKYPSSGGDKPEPEPEEPPITE